MAKRFVAPEQGDDERYGEIFQFWADMNNATSGMISSGRCNTPIQTLSALNQIVDAEISGHHASGDLRTENRQCDDG
jgi:hypothetical protein